MELRKKRKAERKVHFMLIETGSELPNCRGNRDIQMCGLYNIYIRYIFARYIRVIKIFWLRVTV